MRELWRHERLLLRACYGTSNFLEHYNPGRICVQTIFCHIRMHADSRAFDLHSARCLVLARAVIYDVEAVQESAFLVIIARNPDGSR